jgi:tetratricopeptide (TPR) repeat protein
VTIAIQLRLAVMLGYVGERVEAQRLARIALDSAETALGMDHVATMWVRFHVSELEFWSDRTSGERSIAGGIESAILHLGERHPVVLHQRFTLAESIGKAGRPDAAIGIATQALDDLEAEGLGDSFPALDAHAVLAFLHEQAGDVNEAIDHVQRAIGHNARCRGADNPKIVILRADLGRLLLKAGDTAAAKRTLLALSDELRSWHNSYDPRDWKPLVLSAMSSCAMAMKDAGPEALAEAEALAIQAAAELDRLYGPTDRETLDARHTLAAVLATRGQAVRAAAELESLLEAADSHLPADDAELAGYRVLYAHVLQDLGRSEDAAVQLEAARTAMEATGERSELRLAWQLERARLDAAGDPG